MQLCDLPFVRKRQRPRAPLVFDPAAALQKDIHSAFAQKHLALGQLMNSAHKFSRGIKGNLPASRKPSSHFLRIHAALLYQMEQSQLCGVAYLLAVFYVRVIDQTADLQEKAVMFISFLNLVRTQQPSSQLHLLHTHPVLGQGPGFIRADNGHASKALNRF